MGLNESQRRAGLSIEVAHYFDVQPNSWTIPGIEYLGWMMECKESPPSAECSFCSEGEMAAMTCEVSSCRRSSCLSCYSESPLGVRPAIAPSSSTHAFSAWRCYCCETRPKRVAPMSAQIVSKPASMSGVRVPSTILTLTAHSAADIVSSLSPRPLLASRCRRCSCRTKSWLTMMISPPK
jgi:hypothetical protein